MPRYFFDLSNHHLSPDTTGVELPSADEARKQAIVLAGACLKDDPSLVDGGQTMQVRVRDDAGTTFFSVATRSQDVKG
ncbi:DUF6894 family protein [Mangrovicella endophytica]|uniref:DUF6894 family protein n=1 Tax=Mangrovicella endophytica TaxID=2066697 RepID=UPI000C9DD857|nr:hypothetical protein [Mangrovicella endophytica]